MLHRRVRVGGRGIDHNDAAARGLGEVNVVHARSGASDDTEPLTGSEYLGRHAGLAAHDQGIEAGHSGDKLLLGQAVGNDHLGLLVQERQALARQPVGHEDGRARLGARAGTVERCRISHHPAHGPAPAVRAGSPPG